MTARVDALTQALGVAPLAVWRAPGRVNLLGDHTDYCEGFVLPLAIDRDCLLALGPRSDGRVQARSMDVPGVVELAADGSDEPRGFEPAWGRFVAGVVATLTARGARLPGVSVAVSSTVPAGSGLSSSSALSVALTLGLADAAGLVLDRTEVARAALDAEVRATGVPGGLMDQLASLFGVADHALLVDCRSLEVEPIAMPRSLGVVVVHSGLPRSLAESAYAERRASCEAAAARLGIATLRDATLDQVQDDARARHVVTENARVLELAAALRTGDTNAIGPLLLASHASLRDDFDVSTPELDLLVDLLVEHGAYGARLTGAGFGGCVVAVAQRNHADDIVAKVVPRYRAETGLDGLAFSVHAADGAGRVAPERRVSRLVRNAEVELELASGAVTVRWPGRDVRAGPLTARAVVDGTEHVSTDSAGAWRVETGTGAGRPGTWARWMPTAADDRHGRLGLAVHVPTEGGAVVVDATWTGSSPAATVSGLALQGAGTDAPGEVIEDEDELSGATMGVRVLVS